MSCLRVTIVFLPDPPSRGTRIGKIDHDTTQTLDGNHGYLRFSSVGSHGVGVRSTPKGRRRLCERVDAGRPIAHVAAEAGISRRCLAKWYARCQAHGENGLLDHSSRPATSPARTAEDISDLVEALRRQTKHGPARLAADLKRLHGVMLAPATVHRILVRRGLNRLRDLDPPTGEQLREVIGIPPWIPPPSGGGGIGLLRSRAGKADSPPG
ncbi:helix-turn-helix domain-containing protein, partial [Streptomyces mirabilis]|uniref:helix-turn-helix domain-containing protein n=1 Tax=Streptomyces mirabilis TaxID=68239 RepID=UPI0033C21E29